MFIFGHMGIGSKIASPFTRGLPRRAVLLGTILPDLIDKPLHYLSNESIVSTRTAGHTGLFLLALTLAAVARRSRWLAALALGVSTHLLLDHLGDRIWVHSDGTSSALVALFWPMLGPFLPSPYASMSDHFDSILHPWIMGAEIVGLLILGWDSWKRVYQSEIYSGFRERRIARKSLRRARKAEKRALRARDRALKSRV